MFEKRNPRYFHSDGNGIHLNPDKFYRIRHDGRSKKIRVLSEHKNFYLVMVNESYKMTINKFSNDFLIEEYT